VLKDQIANGTLPKAIADATVAHRMIFNDYLDSGVAAFFMVSVIVILAASITEWVSVYSGRKPAVSSEVPFQALPMPVPGD
jgi:carbon starvation protein